MESGSGGSIDFYICKSFLQATRNSRSLVVNNNIDSLKSWSIYSYASAHVTPRGVPVISTNIECTIIAVTGNIGCVAITSHRELFTYAQSCTMHFFNRLFSKRNIRIYGNLSFTGAVGVQKRRLITYRGDAFILDKATCVSSASKMK